MDHGGDLRVGAGLACWDTETCLPDGLLERGGALEVESQLVAAAGRERTLDGVVEVVGQSVASGSGPTGPVVELFPEAGEGDQVGEGAATDAVVVVCDPQPPDRSRNLSDLIERLGLCPGSAPFALFSDFGGLQGLGHASPFGCSPAGPPG